MANSELASTEEEITEEYQYAHKKFDIKMPPSRQDEFDWVVNDVLFGFHLPQLEAAKVLADMRSDAYSDGPLDCTGNFREKAGDYFAEAFLHCYKFLYWSFQDAPDVYALKTLPATALLAHYLNINGLVSTLGETFVAQCKTIDQLHSVVRAFHTAGVHPNIFDLLSWRHVATHSVNLLLSDMGTLLPQKQRWEILPIQIVLEVARLAPQSRERNRAALFAGQLSKTWLPGASDHKTAIVRVDDPQAVLRKLLLYMIDINDRR